MAMSHGLAVHSGARVVTADGKQIGLVKDVRLDRFLVAVRWAPDYWLGTETVGDASEDLVQLLVAKEDLGSAKLHLDVTGPGLN